MVHTKATHGKNSFELSVTVCVSVLRGHCHCCVRLRVYILVRVPLSMVLRVCVSVCVCVRVCQFCKTRCWKYWFSKSPQVSWVNVAICFVSPLHDAKVWNSTLQSLNSSRGLWSCAESVESPTRKVPCKTMCVSPPHCPVTLQFRVKTNGCFIGSKHSVAAYQSSSVETPLEERRNVVLPVMSEQVTEPPFIEDPVGSR